MLRRVLRRLVPEAGGQERNILLIAVAAVRREGQQAFVQDDQRRDVSAHPLQAVRDVAPVLRRVPGVGEGEAANE